MKRLALGIGFLVLGIVGYFAWSLVGGVSSPAGGVARTGGPAPSAPATPAGVPAGALAAPRRGPWTTRRRHVSDRSVRRDRPAGGGGQPAERGDGRGRSAFA